MPSAEEATVQSSRVAAPFQVKSGLSRFATAMPIIETLGTNRSPRASMAMLQSAPAFFHSKCTRLKFRFSPEIAGL
ncbi:hypothetical protein XINFAN_01871 [Pseudogemmobacter humi]|uniref:Uncharacterized protein n=1 Tax=Pseudogemmobacter humi TaxID=2483812 RepID=A0A3P5XAY3_9RHOB|nr:hypothetical protein XINFAN_01871 [Pseudogemmobacter humi]